MHDDTAYLHHMVDAINTIGRYLDGVEVAEFLADTMLQDAVIRQIQIIGEADHRRRGNPFERQCVDRIEIAI